MKYLSVCAGIEAATVAWHPLGWQALAFSEIEKFPRAVLDHHYPDVPLHGDFTLLRDQNWIVDADLLVGGTPCQAFSVAGLRQSLADDRGNLSLEFVRLADAIDDLRHDAGREASIIVWENVPGVLSVKDNAFGCFLGALVGNDSPIVYTGKRWTNAGLVIGPKRAAAWRILDAQYFGLAQRRRRVFVVASARDGFDPAAVLFDSEGVRRDTAPRREEGEKVTVFTASSIGAYREGIGTLRANGGDNGGGSENLVTETLPVVLPTLTASMGGGATNNLCYGYTVAFQSKASATNSMNPNIISPTLDKGKSDGIAIAFDILGSMASNVGKQVDIHSVLRARTPGAIENSTTTVIKQNTVVRRLTPRECERLQGFPDDYTLIPIGTKLAADSPRYKALGNSMAVPVMHWIGNKINMAIKNEPS